MSLTEYYLGLFGEEALSALVSADEPRPEAPTFEEVYEGVKKETEQRSKDLANRLAAAEKALEDSQKAYERTEGCPRN